MGWLTDLSSLVPAHLTIGAERKTLVKLNKINISELQVCQAKMVLREQPFFRPDSVDIYHLLPDGRINITPG